MFKSFKKQAKNYLNTLGYKVHSYPTFLLEKSEFNFKINLDIICQSILYEQDQIYLLQVGAFDGVSNDPVRDLIKKYNIHAILVEPQKEFFKILVNNYSDFSNVFLENVAISEKNGFHDFYFLKNDDLPQWCSQLASFSKENILKHGKFMKMNLEKYLFSEKIECKTIPTLLKDSCFPRLDILQIDAEGYDNVIIQSFDLNLIAPKIICYEHCHLDKSTRNNLLEYLSKFGYKFCIIDPDTIAIRIS